MIELDRISDEIYVTRSAVVSLGDAEIEFLKAQAVSSPKGRARICAHRSSDDSLHEMLIVLSRESYVQPHKHLGKSESFHIIEGEVDVAIFDDVGQISDVVSLGAMGTGRKFFYRLSDSRFHTLLIHSDMLVMHEVTNGPFIKGQSINASFSPSDGNPEETKIYMKNIAREVLEWQQSRTRS